MKAREWERYAQDGTPLALSAASLSVHCATFSGASSQLEQLLTVTVTVTATAVRRWRRRWRRYPLLLLLFLFPADKNAQLADMKSLSIQTCVSRVYMWVCVSVLESAARLVVKSEYVNLSIMKPHNHVQEAEAEAEVGGKKETGIGQGSAGQGRA